MGLKMYNLLDKKSENTRNISVFKKKVRNCMQHGI